MSEEEGVVGTSGRELVKRLAILWLLWPAFTTAFIYLTEGGDLFSSWRPSTAIGVPTGVTISHVLRWRAEQRAQRKKPAQPGEDAA